LRGNETNDEKSKNHNSSLINRGLRRFTSRAVRIVQTNVGFDLLSGAQLLIGA
jgi:hypothetical protein